MAPASAAARANASVSSMQVRPSGVPVQRMTSSESDEQPTRRTVVQADSSRRCMEKEFPTSAVATPRTTVGCISMP